MQTHGSRILMAALVFLFTTSFLLQCTKAQRNNGDTIPVNETLLVREYLKEGFISEDVFRVVIVIPQGSNDDITSIEKRAKQRALMSLQKYLTSQNMTVDQKTRTKLLHLTKGGTLTKRDDTCETRQVYLFQINRRNLKHHVDSIPLRR